MQWPAQGYTLKTAIELEPRSPVHNTKEFPPPHTLSPGPTDLIIAREGLEIKEWKYDQDYLAF